MRVRSALVALITICALVASIAPASPAHAEPEVRVAVARSTTPIEIVGLALRTSVILKNGGVGEVVGISPERITLTPTPSGLTISGIDGDFSGITLDCDSGQARLNGKVYSTPLEVVRDLDSGGMVIVTEVGLERYLMGVVGHEMPPGWPLEALKSQAVAARTYALSRRIETERYFAHVEATVLSQVYGGEARIPDSVARAVVETRGQVLVYDNRPVEAFFHSTCVGDTASGTEIWGRPLPYLPSVACKTGEKSPRAAWVESVPLATLTKSLAGLGGIRGNVTSLKVASRYAGGYARNIEVRTKAGKFTIAASDLRRIVGYQRLPSTNFSVDVAGGKARFRGKGFGHGVGLCQYCAKGMAEAGDTYDRILLHFYRGAELQTLYEDSAAEDAAPRDTADAHAPPRDTATDPQNPAPALHGLNPHDDDVIE